MTAPCKTNDRIRLIQMGDDPCPIPPGTTGTVLNAQPSLSSATEFQITVKWDIDRSLSLIWPIDQLEVMV